MTPAQADRFVLETLLVELAEAVAEMNAHAARYPFPNSGMTAETTADGFTRHVWTNEAAREDWHRVYTRHEAAVRACEAIGKAILEQRDRGTHRADPAKAIAGAAPGVVAEFAELRDLLAGDGADNDGGGR